jgi:hypothetical protein
MLKSFRLKRQPERVVPDLGAISLSLLAGDPTLPLTIRQLNELPDSLKRRVYRGLLPPSLLVRFGIDPLSWTGPQADPRVFLRADAGSDKVQLTARAGPQPTDEFLTLELADNALNGIELNLIVLSDPSAPHFSTDCMEDGEPTMFGTLRRNLKAEAAAMEAGLAPAQIRAGLRGSGLMFAQLDVFLSALGHRACFLEPLTYASAWIFERRGLAYVRGHKLMDDIHREFQPGGVLHAQLDDSSPFRRRGQADTVRGRAWAIHDGILSGMGTRWDKLRMVMQIGRQAGVDTFPGGAY